MHRIVGIIGLGVTGINRAVAFSSQFETIALDEDPERIEQLKDGLDGTRQATPPVLTRNRHLAFTHEFHDLRDVDTFIITTPTALDANGRPDLTTLEHVTNQVAQLLRPSSTVVYESTLFPGATEGICIPALENKSGLRCGEDFSVGYSPELESPDSTTPTRLIAGCCQNTATQLEDLYSLAASCTTKRVESIQVAEATQLVDHSHRDLNQAFRNEVSDLLGELDINANTVFETLELGNGSLTSQNGFSENGRFEKGSEFLAYSAQACGMEPALCSIARYTNRQRPEKVKAKLHEQLKGRNLAVSDSRILVLGFARMANSASWDKSPVLDLIRALEGLGSNVHVLDPWVDWHEVPAEHKPCVVTFPESGSYDAIILAVGHRMFTEMGFHEIHILGKPDYLLFDATNEVPVTLVDKNL
ncbi:MAG: nucleotide sugar dehydrogenase [Pseudomonadota bacterium]